MRTLIVNVEVKQGYGMAVAFRAGAGEPVQRSTYELSQEFTLPENVTLEDVHHAFDLFLHSVRVEEAV